MSLQVTAIVPAYNEEKKIKVVLNTLLSSGEIEQVIVVNDGSTDKTLSVIGKIEGIDVINLPQNCGKAAAIVAGVQIAKGDIVAFIDADLTGLTKESVHELIAPLRTDEYDASIGYRSAPADKLIFMPLSGERAYFKKDIIPHMEKIKNKGYGMELYLNYAFKDKRIKLLGLKGVKHTMKYSKQKYHIAFKGIVDEFGDIFKEIFRQKDPISFFIHAYLYPFYIKKPLRKKSSNSLFK
ncbi:MAG TPA: glycosyltransferase [Patescibacteria group bacterium]|nr:glycosyltransferase [Patescibacteria group bacterium]